MCLLPPISVNSSLPAPDNCRLTLHVRNPRSPQMTGPGWAHQTPSTTVQKWEGNSRNLAVAPLLKPHKGRAARAISHQVHLKTEEHLLWGEGQWSRCKQWWRKDKGGPGYWIPTNWGPTGLLFPLCSAPRAALAPPVTPCAPADLNRFLFMLKPLVWYFHFDVEFHLEV